MSSNKRVPQRPKEAPFRDEEILRADDPRPQRVAQYPVKRSPRKSGEEAIPTGVFDTEKHDEELRASYGADNELGYKPVFVYVERGPGQGQLVQVRQGPLVVGRASVSELRLQHPSISRRHAQITRIGEQFYVKDLGSQNGSFVNKQRIATEIEIFPGDTIAMGNAVLKLRGPLKKGEGLDVKEVVSKPRKTPPKTAIVTRAKASNATKIAIFAGAVGFGLALVLAIAFVKLPSAVTATKSAGAKLEQKGDDLVVAVDEVKTRVIDDAIQKKMAERMAARAAAPAEEAQTPAPSRNETAPKPISVASLSREPRESSSSSTPSSGGGGEKSKRSILAPYEKGDADESLELAQKAGDKELASNLSKFIKTYDAANEAMVANQGGPAIKNFEAALKIDEQISTSGNSKKGAEIRKQLSKLYTMVGFVHVKNDNNDDAKQAFTAAVKFDSSNDQAKAQLKKLGGDVPEDSPRAKKSAKGADDAFSDGDDEKPAPKKAKKAPTKSRSQAIDDAFGD